MRSASISSQGTAVFASASKVAIRRPSSASWLGVKRTSSDSRLSHSLPMSSSRSSGVNLAISGISTMGGSLTRNGLVGHRKRAFTGAACGAQPVGIEVDVFLPIAGQPAIEIRGALVARAARPVKLKRLFDFSYNPSLAARELAGEIARSDSANGKP